MKATSTRLWSVSVCSGWASSPAEQYAMDLFFGNLTVTSPRSTIASPTERTEDVTAIPGQDAGGAFPEDVVITTANELDAASQTPPP